MKSWIKKWRLIDTGISLEYMVKSWPNCGKIHCKYPPPLSDNPNYLLLNYTSHLQWPFPSVCDSICLTFSLVIDNVNGHALFTNTLPSHHLKIKEVAAATELNSNEKTGYTLQNIYVGIKSQEFKHITAFSFALMHYNVSFAEVLVFLL